jgi:hypothetical protein
MLQTASRLDVVSSTVGRKRGSAAADDVDPAVIDPAGAAEGRYG